MVDLPLNFPTLSQQDPRWKDNKLGTSDNTIGLYGCILTCLGIISGDLDLNDVNQRMIDNGGFVNGDLTYWVKVPLALPNLEFVWRSWSYDNNAVRDWIYNQGYPVIVQVDATPIGAPRSDHYVVYIGNKQLIDPWTGTVRPTSDFPDVKGYIQYKVHPQTLEQKLAQIIQNQDSLDQKVSEIKALFNQ